MKDPIHSIKKRANDIRLATAQYPGMEIGEAYRRYLASRGDIAHSLSSAQLGARRLEIERYTRRACSQPGCLGVMHLEAICSTCVEGKLGYNSKWTCSSCLYRELSFRDYSEWFPDAAG